MTYLSGIKRLILVVLCMAMALPALANKQNGIPDAPNPPRLVNNISRSQNILSPDETAQLEDKLDAFAKTTSNQIAIVITDSLYGFDIAGFATEIAQEWGVGQKKLQNGIVIVIYLGGSSGHGNVFIATGYGLEGAIPDATAETIVQNEMIPNFKKQDYYTGLDKATDVIIGLAKGEYNSKDYGGSNNSKDMGLIIALAIILIVLFISRRGGGKGGYTIGNSGIFFWGGGFGGGGGSFGGGGGGFGGFGGGSFGGGGAGGSW